MGPANDDVLPAVNTARRLISSPEQRNRETAFGRSLRCMQATLLSQDHP